MKEYNGLINLDYPDDDFCIYIMYSSNINDKSIYIGVTEDYKQRAYKHSCSRKREEYKKLVLYNWMNRVIETENEKVLFKIIEENHTKDSAFLREIELIQEHKDKGFDVLNMSDGGKGHKGHVPWNKGLIFRKEKEKKPSRKKKVYKYDNDNNLVAVYDGLSEAGIKENVSPVSVGEWCRNVKSPRNKFLWSYTKLI
jgi:predicted GIY-YIG superfamily endonuclease